MFGDKRWNHDKARPARLDRKTLHRRASLPINSIMIWRKCIRWSKGSSRPSYIWNFGKAKCDEVAWCKMAGKNDMCAVQNQGFFMEKEI